MTWIAAAIIVFSVLVGVVLMLLAMPGIWLTVAVAVGLWIWQPELFSWWTMGVVVGIALASEIADIGASAVGAAKTGGGRAGAIGSIVGTIIGAIAGTGLIPIPVIGTIAGGVIGAGVGALVSERGLGEKTWKESAKIGGGAAAGRMAAMVIKFVAIGANGVILVTAALIP
jgi:uncharacterized protein YqgC (DUF456 family)